VLQRATAHCWGTMCTVGHPAPRTGPLNRRKDADRWVSMPNGARLSRGQGWILGDMEPASALWQCTLLTHSGRHHAVRYCAHARLRLAFLTDRESGAAVEIISTCRGVSVPAPSQSRAAPPPAVGDTPPSSAWKTRPVSGCEQGARWRLVPDPATGFPCLRAPGRQLVPVTVSTP
jgi:hypothetical protein